MEEAAAEPEPYVVLRENWDAVRAWCAAQTQWRHAERIPTGLDYAGARAAVEAMGIEWSEVFLRLQILESETLTVLSEQRARRS